MHLTSIATRTARYVVFVVAGCLACGDTGPETCTVQLASGCWEFLGLEGERVMAVAETPYWGLMAGTFDHGLFRQEVPHRWVRAGLGQFWITSILYAPTFPPRLLVSVMPKGEQRTDAALFAGESGLLNWRAWDGGLAARHDGHWGAWSTSADPGDPNRLYMGASAPILRSDDGGKTWRFTSGSDDNVGLGVRAILVSPTRDGHVWAAGESALFTAFIARSSDWGDTWYSADPTPLYDNAVLSLALDPNDPQRLFAGDVYGVVLSEDGGASWGRVLSTHGPGWVSGIITVDRVLYTIANENRRFAPDSTGPDISDLGLYRSRDGGRTWDTLPVPPGVGGALSVAVDQKSRLLVGTDLGPQGFGLWRVDLSQ